MQTSIKQHQEIRLNDQIVQVKMLLSSAGHLGLPDAIENLSNNRELIAYSQERPIFKSTTLAGQSDKREYLIDGREVLSMILGQYKFVLGAAVSLKFTSKMIFFFKQ